MSSLIQWALKNIFFHCTGVAPSTRQLSHCKELISEGLMSTMEDSIQWRAFLLNAKLCNVLKHSVETAVKDGDDFHLILDLYDSNFRIGLVPFGVTGPICAFYLRLPSSWYQNRIFNQLYFLSTMAFCKVGEAKAHRQHFPYYGFGAYETISCCFNAAELYILLSTCFSSLSQHPLHLHKYIAHFTLPFNQTKPQPKRYTL